MNIKAGENKRNIVKERMTLQHSLCSLHGLCPSISEYLTTPEKIKRTITMWAWCAGELGKEIPKTKHPPPPKPPFTN